MVAYCLTNGTTPRKCRSANMNKQLVKTIRTAVISECLRRGVKDSKDMQKVMSKVSKAIKPMSIAGVQAAVTKGQYTSFIAVG
jgi:hypothetical protein